MSKLPSDINGHVIPRQILLRFPNLASVFYLDTWPFGPPMMVITSAYCANQVTVAHSLPKFAAMRDFMKPMTGDMDLLTLEGDEWKAWKNIFQPGFNSGVLMTMIPKMTEEVVTFCQILREHAASGNVFSMDPLTVNLSLDIIGRLLL